VSTGARLAVLAIAVIEAVNCGDIACDPTESGEYKMSEQLQLRRGTVAQVAAFTGAQGEVVVDTTNNRLVVQDGATAGGVAAAKLAEIVPAGGDGQLAALGIGTAADPSNPLSVYGTSILANSASDVRVKINKAAATNTASFLFQDAWSARAEIGLTGDDNFHFKVSADGNTWHDALDISASTGGVNIAAALGIGTAADPNNPLSIYGASVLVNSASDIRVKINKAAATNTASFLFQDAWAGRAEIGLTGDDNFHFKVSADGNTWYDALDISASTGAVGVGTTTPQCALDVSGLIRTAVYTVSTLPAPSSALAGARAMVTDASSPTFLGTLTGGGATKCPVFCDGSAWRSG
jgi:hypothetical protein